MVCFKCATKRPLAETGAKDNDCVVCMERPPEVVVTKCGHFAMCRQCASLLDSCPLCRVEFAQTDLQRIFLAN